MAHAPRFLRISEEAKARVPQTDIGTVKARLDANASFYLIDVREDHEWARGHLPNAIHLGRGILERDIESRIPDLNADIVLYCGGGFRSSLSGDSLQQMGYTNVASMDGGYRSWNEANYPIVKPE